MTRRKPRPGAGLYITEMGWGSQNNFNEVAFEQGPQGQVRQLRGAYGYLIENRTRLNVKQVYWFSWKDIQGDCNFCDSVGLFREGTRFKPKPAWRAFVALTGGRPGPSRPLSSSWSKAGRGESSGRLGCSARWSHS